MAKGAALDRHRSARKAQAGEARHGGGLSMNVRLLAAFAASVGLCIAFPTAAQAPSHPFDGLKKTVAVDTFQAAEAVGGSVTADGMTAMLTEALVKDGRFLVVERPGLGSIQTEQALAHGGATAGDAAASGHLIGASAIVRAAVTKYQAAAGGQNLQLGGLPLGGMLGSQVGLSNSKAVMEISLRLIDTTTGQIISMTKAEGSASSTSVNANLINGQSGATMGLGAFKASPIGLAGEQAIAKAVEQINAGMRNVPWSALVVDADGGKIYVNAGADRNVQAGLQLAVLRKGKVFTDPSSGEVLDVEMNKIGVIRIDAVREKLSTASVVSGDAPARGDILKLDEAPRTQ